MRRKMLLLLLAMCLSTKAITIIEREVLEVENLLSLGGAAPPVLNQTSSCPCDKLLLSSLGPAVTFQPKVLGVYTQSYTSYNNHPSYRQNYGSDYRLYWLPNGWLVGDKRGAPTGYIHNADPSQTCPYSIVSGWMFYSSAHGSWYPDTTLVLRCVPKN